MMRGLAILTLLFATACQAGGLSVSPMRLNFSAERGIGVVTLTNTSRETLTIEAEVRPWPEDAALQSAKDLVVNPPISTLAPGEKVSVRVGLVRRLATDVERGYRVYFTELPLLRAQDAVGVGVRLRLGIPVFVAAANAQPRALEWSVRRDDDGMLFTASNAGNVHQRVLKLSTQKGSVQYPAAQSSPYVMPGSSTAFRIPGLAARSGDTLVLEVLADDAQRQVEVHVPGGRIMHRLRTRLARGRGPARPNPAALAVALLALGGLHEARAQEALEPEVAGVVLNAVLVSDGELVYVDTRARKAGIWVKASSLAAWRLVPDEAAQREFEAQPYQRVCTQPGPLVCYFDESSAIVSITARSDRVGALTVGAPALPQARPADVQPPGAYVNYDLFASTGSGALKGGYIDSRLFVGQGSGYLRAAALEAGGQRRLGSRTMGWEWDQPDKATTLTLGGFFGGGTAQRAPVPMVGLRYGRNFSLRPDIALAPLPWVRGEVERPSRVDLFVDGLFRRSGDVPYGPFQLQADSLLAGLGELQTVLTDQRGVQTVRSEQYYFAPQLLPQGLSEFSVEAGTLSPDPARLSFSKQPVVSADVRRGWSALHTVSGTAVVTQRTALFGAASDLQVAHFGVLRTGLSWLRRGSTNRARVLLGHEYQSRRFSTLARWEATPRDRGSAGVDPTIPAAALATLPNDRRNVALAASLSLGDRYQVNASAFDRSGLGGERSRSIGAGATYRPAAGVQLSLGVQHVRFPKPSTFVVLSLLVPLDARHLAVLSTNRAEGRTALQWAVQSRPDDSGDGSERQYRAFGQVGPMAHVGASYQRSESVAQWAVEAQTQGHETRAGARVSGALGWLAGHPFAARRIDDSFIVVDSDGQPGLPVFYENRYAGKTNAQGKLLIPGARSYQPNQVSVDAAALPIEYTLARDQIAVVPRSHAGASVRFEIGDGGIMLPVVLANGQPLPAGAQATVSTQSHPAAVGSRSEIFIGRANRAARVTVQWPGGSCAFDYLPDDAGGASAQAGARQCR